MCIPEFLQAVIDGKISLEAQGEFLRQKEKFSAEELRDAVLFLQARAKRKLHLPGAIDVCGTGGSGLPRLNTSTIAAFGLAALGVKVAKHGNRAASGRFGSFDLLEKLGVTAEHSEKLYAKHGLMFLFAPEFYPLMKHFAPARALIGKPTFFNLLGPLLNPAGVQRQIIGTAFREQMLLLAETCKLLEKEHVFIISGADGLDEVTVSGATKVLELKNGKIREFEIIPQDFGLAPCVFSKLAVADQSTKIQLAKMLLSGKMEGPHLDLVCANVALAFILTGKAASLQTGFFLAREAFLSGAVRKLFQAYAQKERVPSILQEIVAHKKKEVAARKKLVSLAELKKNLNPSTRCFSAALQKPGLSLIAEMKRSSPSRGKIFQKLFAPGKIARCYERNGAAAISVLCDEKYFGGSLEDLRKAALSTLNIPLLCKDFLIDTYQIFEARKYGADAMLIIASIFSAARIEQFLEILCRLHMEAIVEVHTKGELQKVLKTSAHLIGVNARDMHTFQMDSNRVRELAPFIPADRLLIAESGIFTRSDLLALPASVQGVLVGTSLMESTHMAKAVQEFSGARPFFKVCGVRAEKTARFCEQSGVDLIGLNFVPESRRSVSLEAAQKIREQCRRTKVVGVFRNLPLSEVNQVAGDLNLDFIQLCGNETLSFVRKCSRPVFFTISITKKINLKKLQVYAPFVAAFIFDGAIPGSGKFFDPRLLPQFSGKFFTAGGLTPENISEYLESEKRPFGIDVASGVETNGQIDPHKIRHFMPLFRNS